MACEGSQGYQLCVYLTTLSVAEIPSAGSLATSNVFKAANTFKNDIVTTHFLFSSEIEVFGAGSTVYLYISNTPL